MAASKIVRLFGIRPYSTGNRQVEENGKLTEEGKRVRSIFLSNRLIAMPKTFLENSQHA